MSSRTAFRTALDAVHHLHDPVPPWDAILGSAKEIVGADAATLIMFNGEQDLLLMHQSGVDSAVEREYREAYFQHDAIAQKAIASPPGRWWDTATLQRADDMRMHPFYGDFMSRHRIGQILAYVVLGDANRRAAIGFQRQTAGDHVLDTLTAGRIAQYFRTLSRTIAERERRSDSYVDTLDVMLADMGERALVTYPSGRLQRCSASARDMLRTNGMLTADGEALTHDRPDTLARLRTTLLDCVTTGAHRSFVAPVTWGNALRFDIAPTNAIHRFAPGENTILIRLRQVSTFNVPTRDELASFFNLTPAEAGVLAGLVACISADDYAAMTGVAARTVRNQIASLMRKMNCSRQSELVRLASMLR
ncbi:LuxR family transcriptional regulator [Burkholderia aenigmatica]|uniref:LuxR family transcriptional regulator n=2 Tax=Burkholderia TaxID=32008 RepID=A0A6J5IUI9_9BURK|nr:helix-turn-helix transcriptional regulator [Burkholderia aenigmatica]CAB3961713.1 LuxR family transcriptional regulator [Burkholderia aenigmatica]